MRRPAHSSVLLRLLLCPSYPCSSPVSPAVTSASVKSTSADSATARPCSFTSSLRLRATLSCRPPASPPALGYRYLCSPASSRPTSSATFALYRNSREPCTLLRPGKNGWLLFKGDALSVSPLPPEKNQDISLIGNDWRVIVS